MRVGQKSGKDIQVKSEIRIWGTANYSAWDISTVLRKLRVAHTIDSGEKHCPQKVVQPGLEVPKVHVSPRVAGYRVGVVNFISASVAELSDTNFLPLVSTDLEAAVCHALRSPQAIVPDVKVWDASSYVDVIAHPSILNKIQTEVYRIQPYTLRKEIQALVLEFFNSRVGVRETMHILEKSVKTEKLKPVFKAALPLRAAVAMLKSKTAEQVAADTGFSAFELLYLTKAKKK